LNLRSNEEVVSGVKFKEKFSTNRFCSIFDSHPGTFQGNWRGSKQVDV